MADHARLQKIQFTDLENGTRKTVRLSHNLKETPRSHAQRAFRNATNLTLGEGVQLFEDKDAGCVIDLAECIASDVKTLQEQQLSFGDAGELQLWYRAEEQHPSAKNSTSSRATTSSRK